MSKLKTHSGAKKRFRVTGNGLVKAGCCKRRHNMRKRSQSMKRVSRQGIHLFAADAANVREHFLRS